MNEAYQKSKKQFAGKSNLRELRDSVKQLIKNVSQIKAFKSLSIGIDTLESLKSLLSRLNTRHAKDLNPKTFQLEIQNCDSTLIAQRLEIKLELNKLINELEEKSKHGVFPELFDRVSDKLDQLSQNIYDLEFFQVCDKYARYHQACQTLFSKVKKALELREKTETKILVQEPIIEKEFSKPIVEQISNEEHLKAQASQVNEETVKTKGKTQPPLKEKINNLIVKIKSISSEESQKIQKEQKEKDKALAGLTVLRQQASAVIKSLRGSHFYNLPEGKSILILLENHLENLKEEKLNLDHFNLNALEHLKQTVDSFILVQTKELKAQLNKWIEEATHLKTQGFYIQEIEGWLKQVDSFLQRKTLTEHTGFAILCDEYARLHQSMENLKAQINEAARVEYQMALRNKDALGLNLKKQQVKHCEFLTQDEKNHFLALVHSIEKEFETLTEKNIKQNDAKEVLGCRNVMDEYKLLIGIGSVSENREAFCQVFRNQLKNEIKLINLETRELYVATVKTALMSSAKTSLDISTQTPHSLKKLYDGLEKFNMVARNLNQFFKAYEHFVLTHRFNLNHNENGIRHGLEVVNDAMRSIQGIFNTELQNLLHKTLENNGVIPESDLKQFEENLSAFQNSWKMEISVSAKKSGFCRHSFNNYLRIWARLPSLEIESRLWSINSINEHIVRNFKNAWEIAAENPLGFFSGTEQKLPYRKDSLKSSIEHTERQIEIEKRENTWKLPS